MEVGLAKASGQEQFVQKVESGLKSIVDRISEAATPQEIAQASISIKNFLKRALDETQSPKAQEKLSELFTSARQTLGMTLDRSIQQVN